MNTNEVKQVDTSTIAKITEILNSDLNDTLKIEAISNTASSARHLREKAFTSDSSK